MRDIFTIGFVGDPPCCDSVASSVYNGIFIACFSKKIDFANNGFLKILSYSSYVFWGQETHSAAKIMIRPFFADF